MFTTTASTLKLGAMKIKEDQSILLLGSLLDMTQTQIFSTNPQHVQRRTKSERRSRAQGYLRRWARNKRRGLPDLGHKHQSPEQERVRGVDCCANVYFETKEDVNTFEAMELMREEKTINYGIAEDYYYYHMTIEAISKKLRLSVDIINGRHGEIKDDVANYVLY